MGTENSRPRITRITRGNEFTPDTVRLADETTLLILGSRGRAKPIRAAVANIPPASENYSPLKVDDQLTIGVRSIKSP